jgi:hypothetical protein
VEIVQMIISFILALVLTPVLILAVLFVIPPLITVCVLGFFSCRAIGKRV